MSSLSVPRHVAIIMDGNGRWAGSRGLPRVEGHRAGVRSVRSVVEESRRLGVRYLTLFCFSSENWKRPKAEVSALMSLFKSHLDSELDLMLRNDIRLRAVGELSKLPAFVQDTLKVREERTARLSGMDLVLAVSYGGREEIVHASRQIAARVKSGEIELSQINEQTFSQSLYAADIPDPDLLIRTSGENRISNFLLWQLAYTEIVVSPVYWPDFDAKEYQRCIQEFNGRARRFGLTAEQVSEQVDTGSAENGQAVLRA